jgi:hypothetical protein
MMTWERSHLNDPDIRQIISQGLRPSAWLCAGEMPIGKFHTFTIINGERRPTPPTRRGAAGPREIEIRSGYEAGMTSPTQPSTPAHMSPDDAPVTAPPGGWPPAGQAPTDSPPAGEGPTGEAPTARTPRWIVLAVIITALVITLAVVGSTVLFRHGGRGAPAHAVSGALAGEHDGEFQLLTGVTAATVRLADLGGDLYQVSTPRDAGIVPSVHNDHGRLQLFLNKTDGAGPAVVDVRLSPRVRWQLRMVGGSTAATVDARGADLAGVDFVGGVTRIEVWLPRPKGVLIARMSGGASEYVVHGAGQTPARVRIGSGASRVTVDSTTHNGVAPGATYAPAGWESTADRYDIDAAGGVATLTLDRY